MGCVAQWGAEIGDPGKWGPKVRRKDFTEHMFISLN